MIIMRAAFAFVATTALLLCTIAVEGLTSRRLPDFLSFPLDSVEGEISGWSAAGDRALPDGVVRTLDATSYLSRTYRKTSVGPLDLFIAFYAQQRAGESMHSPKHCLPGAGWEIWKQDSAEISVNGKPVSVNRYSIQNAGERLLMFYWYQSKDRIIASEFLGKLFLARDSLLTGNTAASIVRITLPDTPAAADEGVRFAGSLIPQVQRCFVGH